jgi:hypothetical protein
MANRSGLLGLARGMRAYFAAQEAVAGIVPSVVVGWTRRSRQDNQGAGGASRVVLIPGLFDATASAPKSLQAGVIDRSGEQNAVNLVPVLRALAWWHQAVTCCVWAVDPARPQEEEGQIAATEDLLELTIQALHNAVDPETGTPAGFANLESFGEPVWTLPPGEAAFGRELVFPFTLDVPLFDQPIQVAYPSPAVARNPAA